MNLTRGQRFAKLVESIINNTTPQIWFLRIVIFSLVVWLVIYLSRSLRFSRGAQFRIRPSDASGLAGRYTPTVSLVVLTLDGHIGNWVARSSYFRQEVIIACAVGVRITGVRPRRLRVVRAENNSERDLLAAALSVARGEIAVLVPPNQAFAPNVVELLAAPFVSPFVGATVGRTIDDGRKFGFVERLDRIARHVISTGAHAFGAVVIPETEALAVRTSLGRDLITQEAAREEPWAVLALSIASLGSTVTYVSRALFVVATSRARTRFMRSAARIRSRRRTHRRLRGTIRKSKVLEGPEKTDIRWAARGALAPVVMAGAWIGVFVLRAVDTSWLPDLLGGVLVLGMYVTPLTLQSAATLAVSAVHTGPIGLLSLIPLLPFISIGVMWSACWALVLRPPKVRK